jgi:hypothetical protein
MSRLRYPQQMDGPIPPREMSPCRYWNNGSGVADHTSRGPRSDGLSSRYPLNLYPSDEFIIPHQAIP